MFENNLVHRYSDFDFDQIFDIRRPPIGNCIHGQTITHASHIQTKLFLKIMSLTSHRQCKFRNPNKRTQLWDSETDLHVQKIKHFGSELHLSHSIVTRVMIPLIFQLCPALYSKIQCTMYMYMYDTSLSVNSVFTNYKEGSFIIGGKCFEKL